MSAAQGLWWRLASARTLTASRRFLLQAQRKQATFFLPDWTATGACLASASSEAALAEAAGVGGGWVALEEGERDRRGDVGEDLLAARPEGIQLRSELVGERDLLLDQVLAGAGQRPERLRLVRVGLEQPQPVH